MYLARDQAHPTPGGGSCRIRVYLPEDPQDAWVVICSELLINQGVSITDAVEKIAAEVLDLPYTTPTHPELPGRDPGERREEVVGELI